MGVRRLARPVTRATNPIVSWVCDYDLSVNDQNRRRAFYREVAKLKEKLHLHGRMSSASVVFTSDKQVAQEIYKIACKYAKTANLYRAILEASKGDSHT